MKHLLIGWILFAVVAGAQGGDPQELLKDYRGDVVLPEELLRTYAGLVAALERGKQEDRKSVV